MGRKQSFPRLQIERLEWVELRQSALPTDSPKAASWQCVFPTLCSRSPHREMCGAFGSQRGRSNGRPPFRRSAETGRVEAMPLRPACRRPAVERGRTRPWIPALGGDPNRPLVAGLKRCQSRKARPRRVINESGRVLTYSSRTTTSTVPSWLALAAAAGRTRT